MSNTLGDGPIDPAYAEQMQHLAQLIDQFFNGELRGEQRKVGFCLLLFNFDDGAGRCNYISNAHRSDVVTLLKEQLARFEGQPELKGSA